jgi:hypothetical protein
VCQESMFDVLEMIYERLSRLFAKSVAMWQGMGK